MAIPTLYVGQCVDWTFTFTDEAGVAINLNAVSQIQVRFQCGGLLQTEAPTPTATTGEATLHTDTAFLDRPSTDDRPWKVQAWVRNGTHWTPASVVQEFTVLRGVAAEA